MKLSDFDYDFPNELIATHPASPRDEARLLVADRESGEITHSHFYDLPDFLSEGDFLVFNESKVIPARLFGKVDGKDVEILLIKKNPKHLPAGKVGIQNNKSLNAQPVIPTSSPVISPPTSVIPTPLSVIPAKAGIQDLAIDSRLHRNDNLWQVMAKPGKKLRVGSDIIFNDKLSANVLDISEGKFTLKFNMRGDDFWREIEKIGEMPLPPYILKARQSSFCHSHTSLCHSREGGNLVKNQKVRIGKENEDIQDYQTIYADKPGSSAAPTAGLHFTSDLMQKIKDKGCDIGFVTLHVGLGTFEPIRTEEIEDHKIHSEYFEMSADLAERLSQAKKEGRRIIAVGTTTVRVIETVFGLQGTDPCIQHKGPSLVGETNIYIYPGYKFQFVDGIITNFHLPKSSLLLLISAFWTRENIIKAYEEAIKNNYRFYSYGDGMMLL